MPLFVDDAWTQRARAWLLTGAAVFVSDWAVAEFSSALSLHVRQGRLEVDERDEAENALNDWLDGHAREEPLMPVDALLTRDLIHRHSKLRTPDALNLAIVLRTGEALATYDHDLADAARVEGVTVVSP